MTSHATLRRIGRARRRAARLALTAAAAAAVVTVFLGATAAPAAAQEVAALREHRWKRRVLVVLAPPAGSASAALYEAQRRDAAAAAAALAERDVLVLDVPPDTAGAVRQVRLRRELGVPGEEFAVVLVGKDGGVKLRRRTLLPAATVLATVDGMPMGAAEARRRRGAP